MDGNECQHVKLVKSDNFMWHHRCIALFERLDQLDFASLYSAPVWSSQHFCILLSLCVWLAGWGLGKEAHFRVESEVQASVWGLGRGEVCGMLGDGWLWPGPSGLTTALSPFISMGLLRDTRPAHMTSFLQPVSEFTANALNFSVISSSLCCSVFLFLSSNLSLFSYFACLIAMRLDVNESVLKF